MIPQFPEFKKLEIEDKDDVQTIVHRYDPYSDFNFVSLWSYNTQDAIEISLLFNNLVIKFSDYLTNESFYSVLGTNNILETIKTLTNFSDTPLKLVPEIVVTTTNELQNHFLVEEDPDNHDYILATHHLSSLTGNKFRGKRNFVKRFQTLYQFEIKPLDLTEKRIQEEILNLFDLWAKQNNKQEGEISTERTAIKRLLHHADKFTLHAFGIYVDKQLIGFSIDELIQKNHAIIHFEKADTQYVGIYQFMKHYAAKEFDMQGIRYINYEQDLGIEGLKQAKKSWRPTHVLKKYKITKTVTDK